MYRLQLGQVVQQNALHLVKRRILMYHAKVVIIMTWLGCWLPTTARGLGVLSHVLPVGHRNYPTSSKQVLTDPRTSDLASQSSVQFGQESDEYDTTQPANVRSMAMYGKQ